MNLKPCPFCGGEVDYNERGKVQCTRACIAIDAEGYANEWNYRPTEDALTARAEKAEADLRDAVTVQEDLAGQIADLTRDLQLVEAERDEALAKLAAARTAWSKGTRGKEWGLTIDIWNAIDAAISDSTALAVVGATVGVEGRTTMYHCIKVPVDLEFDRPVRVVVLAR